MGASDGVTLEQGNEKQVEDWNRRWRSIADERRNKADMQDAMCHPRFKDRANEFIDVLARETRWWRLGHERPPVLTVPANIYERFGSLQKILPAIEARGIRVARSVESLVRYWESHYASDLAPGKHFPSELVVVSNKELGFTKDTRFQETKHAAFSCCDLTNAGMLNGLILALEYVPDGFDDCLYIAMEPWECDDGVKKILELDYTGKVLVVNGFRAIKDTVFPSGAHFVFQRERPRQTTPK